MEAVPIKRQGGSIVVPLQLIFSHCWLTMPCSVLCLCGSGHLEKGRAFLPYITGSSKEVRSIEATYPNLTISNPKQQCLRSHTTDIQLLGCRYTYIPEGALLFFRRNSTPNIHFLLWRHSRHFSNYIANLHFFPTANWVWFFLTVMHT